MTIHRHCDPEPKEGRQWTAPPAVNASSRPLESVIKDLLLTKDMVPEAQTLVAAALAVSRGETTLAEVVNSLPAKHP